MEPNFPSNSKMPRPNRPIPDRPEVGSEKPKTEQPEQTERPEEERASKVIEGEVIVRKQPLGKRLAKTFLSGETPKSVLWFVAMDVAVPALKELVADVGREFIERSLFPHGRNSRNFRSTSTTRSGATTVTNYNGISSSRRETRDRPTLSHRGRSTHDFSELVFPTRAEAQQVLEDMYERIRRFQHVTVAYYCDLAGVTSEFTDQQWGWTNLAGTEPQRVPSGGYILTLPETERLK